MKMTLTHSIIIVHPLIFNHPKIVFFQLGREGRGQYQPKKLSN